MKRIILCLSALSTPAFAALPEEVAEAKRSIYEASEEGLNSARNKFANDPTLKDYPPEVMRPIGVWLVVSLSIGHCSRHQSVAVYPKWESLLPRLLAPLGNKALDAQITLEQRSMEMRATGANDGYFWALSPEAQVHYCEVEMEAVSQILDEIAPAP